MSGYLVVVDIPFNRVSVIFLISGFQPEKLGPQNQHTSFRCYLRPSTVSNLVIFFLCKVINKVLKGHKNIIQQKKMVYGTNFSQN